MTAFWTLARGMLRYRLLVVATFAFATLAGLSLVGGLLVSLIAGDGLSLRPSGILGSLAGAVIITAGWQWYRGRNATTTPRPSDR